MTISPVEKLSVEFGKYIELEQKYKEVEMSIAKIVVSTISMLIIVPFMIAGYLHSDFKGMLIFFIISLFVLLLGYGVYHHKTAILNVEKRESRRNKLLGMLSFIVAEKVKECSIIKTQLDNERERLILKLKSDDYKNFFDELYNFVDMKNLNDNRETLKKIEKIATLYDRKFYSVLFHELKMNVFSLNELLSKAN